MTDRHHHPDAAVPRSGAVVGMIELLAAGGEQYDATPSCKDCGAEMLWEDCGQCDEGYTPPGLLHEVEPDWYDEDDVEPCEVCEAQGGWWYCPDRACSLKRFEAKRAYAAELIPIADDDARPSAAREEG